MCVSMCILGNVCACVGIRVHVYNCMNICIRIRWIVYTCMYVCAVYAREYVYVSEGECACTY